jgi:hypothetical protein
MAFVIWPSSMPLDSPLVLDWTFTFAPSLDMSILTLRLLSSRLVMMFWKVSRFYIIPMISLEAFLLIFAPCHAVGSYGQYFVNGVESAELNNFKLGGLYTVGYEVVNKKNSVFTIKTGQYEAIIVKTYKDLVSVNVVNAGPENFESAVGMMGDFDGRFVARDGVTIIEDHDAFGQEWQVREHEGQLFQTPSAFGKCVPPSSIKQVRRLGEATVSEDAAALACAHYEDEQKRDMCIFDVVAMADLGVADVHGAF